MITKIIVSYCKREFGISKSAVVDWYICLRKVCDWKIEKNNKYICGPSLTVESLFPKKKNNASRILPQQGVFEGTTEKLYVACTPDRSEKIVLPTINPKMYEVYLYFRIVRYRSIEFKTQVINMIKSIVSTTLLTPSLELEKTLKSQSTFFRF